MTVERRELYARRRWVGQRLERVEDAGMLTGATRFVTDASLPRTAEAAFVRSPYAKAAIRSIEAGAARAHPGVIAVLTGEDVAHVRPMSDIVMIETSTKTQRPALAAGEVRYVGEPVVMVLAESRYVAEDAAELVDVEYEPLDEVVDLQAALAEGAALVHDGVAGNVYHSASWDSGGTDDAFERGAHVVRRRLHFQRVVTAPLETCGILAEWDAGTGELTCSLSTQGPHGHRLELAAALGLPESRVRVVAPAVGGAFGGKESVLPEYLAVAVAAMRLGRPVRWVEDRQEALTANAQGKEQETELEAAFDEDGQLLAMRGRFVSDTGAYSVGVGAYVEFLIAATTLPGLYRLPEYAWEAAGALTNKAPIAPFRGVGMTTSQTLREVVLDEAARALGVDRMELRRRNLLEGEATATVTGDQYEGGTYRQAFERALELIGYRDFLERQAAARAEGRLLGLGISPFVEIAALGPPAGMIFGFPMASHDNATVTIDLTGKIIAAVPTFSHGQGHHTAFAQLTADIFGVDPSDVRIVDGDTGRTPWGLGTFGSRSAVFGGGTIVRAATAVREKLLRVAAILLEASTDDLDLGDGFVSVRGTPDMKIPFAALAGAAHFAPQVRAELADPTLSATAFFDPPASSHSNGCIAATVAVDPETGAVKVDRVVVVEDCGTKLNPLIVDGQIRGGVAQGIGIALLERYVYDESGQPLTTTLSDYLLPRATDLPDIEIEHLETPSPTMPGGMKGMSEGPAAAAPAAIICAVLDAIAPHGTEIEALPLTPQVISDALDDDV